MTVMELQHVEDERPPEAPQVLFAVERLADVWPEAEPLTRPHWDEIAKNKGLLKLNPDLEKYERLDAGNHLLLVTARADGKLVGYCLWIIIAHPHYKHVHAAEEDLHFLLPEYRSGGRYGEGRGYGFELLRAARDAAIARGARLLAMREKVCHEHPALMEALGFVPTDIVYTLAVKE
jgi:GNAT superfamily N-acetyltransferase